MNWRFSVEDVSELQKLDQSARPYPRVVIFSAAFVGDGFCQGLRDCASINRHFASTKATKAPHHMMLPTTTKTNIIMSFVVIAFRSIVVISGT